MSRSKKPANAPAARAKSAAGGSEDAALWQHVTESVKPLTKPRRRTTDRPNQPVKPAASQARKPSAPPPISAPAARPAAKTAAAPPSKGFDRATETKFKRGDLEIEGRIDLHGMTQDAAYRALMRFIDRARAQDKRTLLVITGKGRLSEGGGVLRRLLPQWLEAGPHAAHILACTSAHARHGGTGAYYIRLRRTRVRD